MYEKTARGREGEREWEWAERQIDGERTEKAMKEARCGRQREIVEKEVRRGTEKGRGGGGGGRRTRRKEGRPPGGS